MQDYLFRHAQLKQRDWKTPPRHLITREHTPEGLNWQLCRGFQKLDIRGELQAMLSSISHIEEWQNTSGVYRDWE